MKWDEHRTKTVARGVAVFGIFAGLSGCVVEDASFDEATAESPPAPVGEASVEHAVSPDAATTQPGMSSGRATVREPIAYFPFNSCSETSPEVMGTGLEAILVGSSCDGFEALSEALGGPWNSKTALVAGAAAYADAGNSPIFEPAQLTVSAWVFTLPTCADTECTIVSKGNTNADSNGYFFRVKYGSLVLTLAAGAIAVESDVAGPAPSYNTWHHAAFTFDGSRAAVYLDGVEVGTRIIEHGITYGDEHFLIGAMTDRSYDFDGYLDDVLLWDYAKTAAQVADLYESYFGLK